MISLFHQIFRGHCVQLNCPNQEILWFILLISVSTDALIEGCFYFLPSTVDTPQILILHWCSLCIITLGEIINTNYYPN